MTGANFTSTSTASLLSAIPSYGAQRPSSIVILCETGPVYIGGSSAVTASTGFTVAAGAVLSVELFGGQVWVIGAGTGRFLVV